MALALLDEALRVFAGGYRIMDGSGPDDDQQAVVRTVNDAVDGLPGVKRGLRGLGSGRKLAQDVAGREQFLDFADPDIVDVVQG